MNVAVDNFAFFQAACLVIDTDCAEWFWRVFQDSSSAEDLHNLQHSEWLDTLFERMCTDDDMYDSMSIVRVILEMNPAYGIELDRDRYGTEFVRTFSITRQ